MHSVVVGLGKTGASCLRYLAKRGIPVSKSQSAMLQPTASREQTFKLLATASLFCG